MSKYVHSKYIRDLASNLIGKNRYEVLPQTRAIDNLVGYIKLDLMHGDVRKMRPETLGRIMCSFEIGEVMSAHPGKEVTFSGDCEDMLRELVALCLAYVIRDRLVDHERMMHS